MLEILTEALRKGLCVFSETDSKAHPKNMKMSFESSITLVKNKSHLQKCTYNKHIKSLLYCRHIEDRDIRQII
jgi:hypothetical protein